MPARLCGLVLVLVLIATLPACSARSQYVLDYLNGYRTTPDESGHPTVQHCDPGVVPYVPGAPVDYAGAGRNVLRIFTEAGAASVMGKMTPVKLVIAGVITAALRYGQE